MIQLCLFMLHLQLSSNFNTLAGVRSLEKLYEIDTCTVLNQRVRSCRNKLHCLCLILLKVVQTDFLIVGLIELSDYMECFQQLYQQGASLAILLASFVNQKQARAFFFIAQQAKETLQEVNKNLKMLQLIHVALTKKSPKLASYLFMRGSHYNQKLHSSKNPWQNLSKNTQELAKGHNILY